jgi:hypothetical protein
MNDNDFTSLTSPLCALSLKQVENIVDAHNQNIVFPQLSAQLTPTLLQLQQQHTISNVLSSLQVAQTKINSLLSAVPVHPYDKYKALYYKPSKQILPTLSNLPVPKSFDAKTATSQLTAISHAVNDRTMSQVAYLTANPHVLSSTQVTDIQSFCNAFACLSGDRLVVDHSKVSNHFEFLETVRGISLEDVQRNPIEAAQKIVSYFIRMYQ